MLILRRIVHRFSVLPPFYCILTVLEESNGGRVLCPRFALLHAAMLHRQNIHLARTAYRQVRGTYRKDYYSQMVEARLDGT